MRIRARPAVLSLGAVAAALLLGSGQATAGGPTSVLVANPEAGGAAALYADDEHYQDLMSALEPSDGDHAPPAGLSAGPGTPAINITWMWHDVTVWRVDQVRLDMDGGPWVLTNEAQQGNAETFWTNDTWHRAADPDRLLEVLDSLGVLSDGVPTAQDAGGDAEPTARADDASPVASSTPPEADGLSGSLWWLLPVAAGGAVLGALGRPYARRWVRRWRPSGPRQQLIDT